MKRWRLLAGIAVQSVARSSRIPNDVTLPFSKQFSSIITPPPISLPEYDQTIFTSLIQASDRMIPRSIPQIDKIELKGAITPQEQHHPTPGLTGQAQSIAFDKEMLDLTEKPWELGLEATVSKSGGAKRVVRFTFAAGPRSNTALLEIRRHIGQIAAWSYRIEFNPRKCGTSGLRKIMRVMSGALIGFDPEKLLGNAYVTGLDIAVDLIGVAPQDLVVRMPKAGKTTSVRDQTGRLETAYFYGAKPVPTAPPKKAGYKTTGPLRLRLYDRVALKLANAKPAPYGDIAITRVERTHRWTKNAPSLGSISKIKNPWLGYAIQFVGDLPHAETPAFQRQLAAWRGYGMAADSLGWPELSGLKMLNLFPSPLVDGAIWTGWPQGIAASGLQKWIDLSTGT